MQRVEIIVKGNVQRVGYRDRVEQIARELNITGFVENLKPYDVKIVAEGDEKNIKNFIETIKIKKPPIDVKSIEVNYKKATNEFEYFEIKRGEWQEELGERMDFAGNILYEIKNNTTQMLEKQDQMLEKQDQMLEKQDQTIGALKEIKADTGEILKKQDQMLEKQDQMLEKQDQMLEKQDKMLEKQDQMLEKQDQMLEKQDQTIGALKEIKADTGEMKDSMKSIPTILEEILYLKDHQKSMEAEIIKIKQTLKIS